MGSIRKRQSFDVGLFRDGINKELRLNSSDRSFRLGLCEALEAVLEETRQYAGWEYLEEEAGVERDHRGKFLRVADHTRRRYLSVEEAEEEGAERVAKLKLQLEPPPPPRRPRAEPTTSSSAVLSNGLKSHLRAANNRDDSDEEEAETRSGRRSMTTPERARRR